MQRAKKSSFIVFIAGTCLSLAILLYGFVFLNPDQCPTGYTQQQIAQTGCIIGANIGLGLAIFFSMATEAIAIIVASGILVTPLLIKFFNKHMHSWQN